MTRTALQIFLGLLGSVAVVAGLSTVLLGVESILGAEEVSGTIDSEMRFFAVWYVAAGVVLLRTIPRVEMERTTIGAVALLFFLAGCARALSWLVVGRPRRGRDDADGHRADIALRAPTVASNGRAEPRLGRPEQGCTVQGPSTRPT